MFPICFFLSFEFVQSHPIGATAKKRPSGALFLRVGAEDEPLKIVDPHEFARPTCAKNACLQLHFLPWRTSTKCEVGGGAARHTKVPTPVSADDAFEAQP